MEYNPYNHSYGTDQALDARYTQVMKRVYVNMTLGLLVTAFVSMFCAGSAAYMQFMMTHSWMMIGLMLVQLGIVIGISAGINKLSSAAATAIFYVYAIIMGMALAPIFLIYTGESIAKTFFITAGTFGAMSVYGYFTNRDLTRVGSILFMALIGLIIASVVNMFLHSSSMEWIITIGGVIIFVGLTAWDTQQIKRLAQAAPQDSYGRLAVLGALNLYLDFINLFLYLLRIFGGNRD